MDLVNMFKVGKLFVTRHSPEILTGFGIGGGIFAAVLAVKQTPKAIKLIEEEKERTGKEKLTPAETVKTTWKVYAAPVAIGAGSIACIIFSDREDKKRIIAATTAYELSDKAFSEYKNKVIEEIGHDKERDIRDKVAQDRVMAHPESKAEIIMTGHGDTLCFDVESGRYYKSDIEFIKQSVNEFNKQMLSEMDMTLNDFYSFQDLPGIGAGGKLGWSVEKGLVEVEYSSQLTDLGTPCLVIDFRVGPAANWRCDCLNNY